MRAFANTVKGIWVTPNRYIVIVLIQASSDDHRNILCCTLSLISVYCMLLHVVAYSGNNCQP